MSTKSTEIEKLKRVQIVEEMILKGCNKPFIVRYASENWQIKERMCEKYIQQASQKIKKDFEVTFDKEEFKSEVFGRFQDLYRKNYTIQDFRECRNILKDLREMLGLNAPVELKTSSELSINKEVPLFPDNLKNKD